MEEENDREKLLQAEDDLHNSSQNDNVDAHNNKYGRISLELEESPSIRGEHQRKPRIPIPRILSSIDKRYLLALSVPAFFLVIYIMANFSTWMLENPSDLKVQVPQSHLSAETELKALRLLQKQQQGLLRLWGYMHTARLNNSSPFQQSHNQNTSSPAPVSDSHQNAIPSPPPKAGPPKTPSHQTSSNATSMTPPHTSSNSNSTSHKSGPKVAPPVAPASFSRPNVTSPVSVPPTPTANRSLVSVDSIEGLYSGFMGAFAAELLEQIKLNQEVQETLLQPQELGNGSVSEIPDSNMTSNFVSGSADTCKKLSSNVERKTIKWKSRRDRFLVAICLSGQMSNHLICLEKHMFFAALLNRVLVLPSPRLDYQYEHALDIQHMKDCLGANNILTYEEFSSKRRGHLHINKLICYIASPPCFMDDEHVKKYRSAGWSIDKTEIAWPEDAELKGFPSHPHAEEIVRRFSTNEEVIGVGDLFFADVEEQWVMQQGGPLQHNCKTIIKPNPYILLTAQRFAQTYLGGNFIALHFRRYGFLKFCNAKEESCFFPIPQAANCVLRKIRLSNSPVIYLSTDAPESETSLLQALMVLDGQSIPLVKRPPHDGRAKWDALLYRHHLHSDDQVFAMLDKTICALSSVFIGTPGSTFTDDIIRLRRDWGTASSCDEYLCQGEHPNFQADMD